MARSLHPLFDAIASARNEQELQLAIMDTVGQHFGVQRSGIYLLNDPSRVTELEVQSIPEACVAHNPVLGYVVERHVPAHEGLVLPPADWKQLCPRHDHGHVMTGPIVSGGRLVGTVNFTRMSGTPAFDTHDIADLSALCLHLSAKFATLQTQPTRLTSPLASRLTPRELEIAELVAQGLTNVEIGAALWIQPNSVKQALKRMFRKLEVSTRAQLVAQLQSVLCSRPVIN
jgi:DNA-binding CsgD family transcriptional regulator